MDADRVADQDVYRGRILTVRLRTLRGSDGRQAVREVVEHAAGAAVVAIAEHGDVVLVEQQRPAVGARVLELPAGLVDEGEEPRACAARELEEETGYRAATVEPLVSVYTSPGFTTEVIHIFVARNLTRVDARPDEEEDIAVVRLPLAQALERVLSGERSDAKTVAGLLAYARQATAAARGGQRGQ